RVTGKVTTATEPAGLPGVNVVVKGTTSGTITDVNGNYAMDIDQAGTIVFSFIGTTVQEIPVDGKTVINVVLVEEATELNEVVVMGYSSIEAQNITSAVATVKSSAVKDFAITGVDQALQGQAAGVQVTQSSGTPG